MLGLDNFANAALPELLNTPAPHPPLPRGGHCPERLRYDALLTAGGDIRVAGAVTTRMGTKLKDAKAAMKKRRNVSLNSGPSNKAKRNVSSAAR